MAKAVPGVGWRVWDRKLSRWWGNFFGELPTALLAELNGARRPERLVELARDSAPERRRRAR